jgi:hypothetical protein
MVRMDSAANRLDDPGDAAALARYGAELVQAVDEALPGWAARMVVERWSQWSGEPPSSAPAALLAAAQAAGEQTRAEVVPALRALLATDVDEQRSNPLALVRGAVKHPSAVLAAAGVPPVERDADARRLFPDDVYDLAPAAFADLAPSVHEPGLVWGAAKAHVVLARRRRAGQR